MPGDNELHRDSEESVRHAQWVREHAQMDESGFPEYPDELSRRGASRGAVPNGNPWEAVDPDQKPGRPEWDADTEPAPWRTDGESHPVPQSSGASVEPSQRPVPSNGDTAVGNGAVVSPSEPVAPPVLGEPSHRPAIIIAQSDGDERIGHDIGEVLATSKALDGKHLVVEVVDGEVYLLGTVADQTVKSQVEQLASSVRGVACIHNELDLRH